jgi:hypothetical protein
LNVKFSNQRISAVNKIFWSDGLYSSGSPKKSGRYFECNTKCDLALTACKMRIPMAILRGKLNLKTI